jgi:hypothetical protein
MNRRFGLNLFAWAVSVAVGCSSESERPPIDKGGGASQANVQMIRVYRLDGHYYDDLTEAEDATGAPPVNKPGRS